MFLLQLLYQKLHMLWQDAFYSLLLSFLNYLFLLLLLVLPLTTAKTPPMPVLLSFWIVDCLWWLLFLCLCYTGFLSFRCAGRQGRTRTGVQPESTTRIKERLKARLFAFLKRKADYAIRGSTISPTLMAGGGGNVENNLIGIFWSGFRVRAIVIVSQRAIPRKPAT